MMMVYQVSWAIFGLFFGLLLVAPHHIISTRTCTSKLICVLIVLSSLIGMLGFFNTAWFFVALAVMVITKLLVTKVLLAIAHNKQAQAHKVIGRKL